MGNVLFAGFFPWRSGVIACTVAGAEKRGKSSRIASSLSGADTRRPLRCSPLAVHVWTIWPAK